MAVVNTGIYLRISQDREGREAGIDRQSEDCRKLAAANGWEIVEVYTDNDSSAYSGKPRPAYERMLKDLRSGRINAVVANDPTRLYRRMVDLIGFTDTIEAAGAQVATVKAGYIDLSTAAGRFNARIMGAAAAYESEQKAERITRAAEQRAKQGKFSGGMRPYGYEKDGVTIRESEAQFVRMAVDDLLAGVSLRQVTKRLHESGARTATGKVWVSPHLRLVLLSSRIAGIASYHGAEVGKAEWPGLVDEQSWRAMKAILEDPRRRTNGVGPTPRNLLSGVMVCGKCGKKCRVSSGNRRRVDGSVRKQYRCPQGHVTRLKDPTEAWVVENVLALLEQQGVRASSDKRSDANLSREAESLRGRLNELAESFAAGELTREQLVAGTAKVRERLAEVEAQLAQSSTRPAVSVLDGENPREAWAKATIGQQRAIVSELVEVVVNPWKSGARPKPGEGMELKWKWVDSGD